MNIIKFAEAFLLFGKDLCQQSNTLVM